MSADDGKRSSSYALESVLPKPKRCKMTGRNFARYYNGDDESAPSEKSSKVPLLDGTNDGVGGMAPLIMYFRYELISYGLKRDPDASWQSDEILREDEFCKPFIDGKLSEMVKERRKPYIEEQKRRVYWLIEQGKRKPEAKQAFEDSKFAKMTKDELKPYIEEEKQKRRLREDYAKKNKSSLNGN